MGVSFGEMRRCYNHNYIADFNCRDSIAQVDHHRHPTTRPGGLPIIAFTFNSPRQCMGSLILAPGFLIVIYWALSL